MNLGEVQLIAPYSADSQRVQVNDLSGFQIKSEIVPSRATIYSRADLSVHTTYLVTALGGSSIALGGVIEGIDRAYAPGDPVHLQIALADATTETGFSAPAFTAFGITGQGTPIEVGATIPAGATTFTWTTSNSINVKPNSISIVDTTGSTTLASGLANTGTDTITIGAITNILPATQVWTINGVNTQNATFSRTYTVSWLWRVYAGDSVNVTLTANQIKALTAFSSLKASFAGTYAITQTTDYAYFCYPDAMGSVSSFVDGNTGFPISMATSVDNAAYSHTANGWSYALVSVTNAQSIATNYRVYRTQYTFTTTPTLLMEVS